MNHNRVGFGRPVDRKFGAAIAQSFIRLFSKSFAKVILYVGVAFISYFCVVLGFPAIAQNPGNTIQQFLSQGSAFYEAGQYASAIHPWEAAEVQSRTHRQPIYRALSLSYLSLAYQDLGQWDNAQIAIDESIAIFQAQPLLSDEQLGFLAQALTNKGSLLIVTGHPDDAIEQWETAQDIYATLGDTSGILGSQINQVRALQMLGFRHRAQDMLQSLERQLDSVPDNPLKVIGLRSLGNAYRAAGQFERSHTILQSSLTLANRLHLEGDASTTRMSLAHTLKRSGNISAAADWYRQVANTAPSKLEQSEARVSLLGIFIDEQSWDEAGEWLNDALNRNLNNDVMVAAQQFPSRRSINLQVQLAEHLTRLYRYGVLTRGQSPSGKDGSEFTNPRAIATLLSTAIAQARDLQDSRAESYALGKLGYLYEQTGQWADAAAVTQEAKTLAQAIDAADLGYQWHWQTGRILLHQHNRQGAIAAYQQAGHLFEQISDDLATSSSDTSFSFQIDVEPMYQEWLTLLIGSDASSDPPTSEDLRQARTILEALQLRELENYFASGCLDITAQSLDQLDTTAAVLYPVFLPEQIAVLLALPNSSLELVKMPVNRTDALETVQQFYQSLNPVFSDDRRLQLGKTLYDWLIQPVTPMLERLGIQTLVFVLDSEMRGIPMAALHDGQHYLVESYRVAIAPTMSLLNDPVPLSVRSRVLFGGMTDERQGFQPLPAVAKEAEHIAAQMPADILLNAHFNELNLEQSLDRAEPQILHLATHGQFSSDASQTFLLTWDDRIDLEELRHLVQPNAEPLARPLDLLVLSACETAVGDDRALLGLAGVAVRSGAQSTLASLWSVNDESTAEFMTAFYRSLAQPGTTKADALQHAQVKLLHQEGTSHPFHWAPFVLIGNWL